MRKKYYLHCPDCKTRMIKTGEKAARYSVGDVTLNVREYKCPYCTQYFLYDETRNLFF